MKPYELVILSGKGGTGKTNVSASLAAWYNGAVLTDADVDGANLELVLQARKIEEGNFPGRPKAVIKPYLCSACGRCADLCRFDAVSPSTSHQNGGMIMRIDMDACEGCDLCRRLCPTQAITLVETPGGTWKYSTTPYGPLFHAVLAPGGENSGKLVALLRKKARALAEQEQIPLLITDGPPGSGCPVIATITGAHQVLLVTEPTPSGLSDARRVNELCRHFRRPVMVAINKFDLHAGMAAAIEDWARDEAIPVVGRLPYDECVPQAVHAGVPVFSRFPSSPWSRALQEMTRLLALPTGDSPESSIHSKGA
jgi:MinD superfamily P-loop ATPase